MKQKGNGSSGGGLKARQKWYDENATKSGGMMPDGNGNNKCKYHRPGSQNKRK
jgi:hypothetical protein